MGQKHAENRPVTRADWPELHPMPERQARIGLGLVYDDAQMAAIRLGFKPTDMDEKWFLCFADDYLYFHRSWTGYLIFIVPFKRGEDGMWYADQAVASRDHEEYGTAFDEAEERRLIAELIDVYLLDPDYEYVNGFMAGVELAGRPNYLGSPQVVRDVVAAMFASRVGWWTSLRDNSLPEVTAREVQDTEHRVASIFSGEDPDYTAMPWHSVDQLGRVVIARFNLNAEYCADESLTFVMVEAVSAVALAIGKILSDYLQDEMAQWPDAIRQLHELERFVESVLLGTADITHPGKTLHDFQWLPVVVEEEDMEDALPLDPHLHPCLDDKGKTVHIKHPHRATSVEAWDDSDSIATFVPGGDCPAEINGIDFVSWDDHPEGEDWGDVEGQLEDLDEPPMHSKHGLKPASGCVIEEPDGRVWAVSPTNEHGGYINTFPKGKAEDDEISWQANAIKEAYEESGLQVRIIGFIGDVERTTSVTRYYRAVRVGGMPVDVGWESQAVHLVPIRNLKEFLGSAYDHQVIELAYNIQ